MDLQHIREQFPVTHHYNFMNHAAVAPLSKPAADAMRQYIDQAETSGSVNIDFYKRVELIRRSSARLINASPDEVTFVKNTTEGLGWVAKGLNWNTGDNVVTTNVEFPANMYPWMDLESRGVKLKTAREENGRIPTERIAEMIDHRTRVLAISAVQYASGYRADLAELGRICKEKGVLFCVDAIQALGAFPIDVQEMNIDFLSADGHKWLCGPEGCGVFFCNEELIGHLKPTIAGWLGMKNAFDFGNYQFEFVDNARKFDTGSYNLAGVFGLGGSIDLFLEVGVSNIASHIMMLTDRLIEGVREKGYRVLSSRREGEASGIVSFGSDLHDPKQIQQHLLHEHRLVISVRNGRLRVSPHLYNSPEEIDRLIELLPGH